MHGAPVAGETKRIADPSKSRGPDEEAGLRGRDERYDCMSGAIRRNPHVLRPRYSVHLCRLPFAGSFHVVYGSSDRAYQTGARPSIHRLYNAGRAVVTPWRTSTDERRSSLRGWLNASEKCTGLRRSGPCHRRSPVTGLGASQSETEAGCIVSSTTPTISPARRSRSTSSR